MDVVLQNFRKSFAPFTPFFYSLLLDLPATMEELYRRTDRYSTLEDNIRAATQTVMITSKPAGNGKPEGKKQFEPGEGLGKNQKQTRDPPSKKREPPQFTPLNITYKRLLPLFATCQISSGPRQSIRTPLRETHPCDAITTGIMVMKPTYDEA